MRTTLDIGEDVLAAAKERARLEGKTTGRLVSDMLRQAMTQGPAAGGVGEAPSHYGFRPFASGWASCPLTQNGCIRIMSQRAYPGALTAAAVAGATASHLDVI